MWPFIIDLILGRGLMLRLVSFSVLILMWLILRPAEPPGPEAATPFAAERAQ